MTAVMGCHQMWQEPERARAGGPHNAAVAPPDAATVAVVTGAGRGIGRAIALRLAGAGHPVVAAARTRDQVEATAAAAAGVVPLVADVAVEAEVERIAAAAAELGPLEIWVNNAAVADRVAFADLDPPAWDRVLGVNLRGAFLGCRAAWRLMLASGGGVIVNIGSLSGVANVEKFPGLTAYNVSKAGVIALTEAVALEGRPHHIRCVALSPGAVDTEMLRRAAPHLRAGVTPEDIAALVAWLVRDEAAPLTGVNIPVFSNA
jgi:NAD(P)-dependent dehydrogenase (short-subunit alcohol dehydrogenase family)